MKIKELIKVFSLAFLFSLLAGGAYALDYPHFGINNIGCDSCHFVYGSQPSLLPPWTSHVPVDIDDTQYNTLCWSCHNDIEAPYVRTHSSLQTDNSYGDWTVECRVCHNPHYQRQSRTYGSESYLYSGTSTNVTATSITQTGAGWTADQYKGFVVYPNTAQINYNYKITGNTNDTLTLEGPIDLSKVSAGNTFAIVYGKLINNAINTPNSGSKEVKFFNSTGANSYADGDGTYNGICEVCHTQTSFHRNDATGSHAHNSGLDCMTCHSHTQGFKGTGCDICHGYPPVDGSTLVSNPGITGSLTAGAHDFHVATKGFDCTQCHYDSAGSGVTHNNSLTITMGFSMFGGAYQGGSYDGQAGVNYDTTVTAPVTSVSNTGSKTCSNIYCHSTGQSTSDKDDATPAYASPVWDNAASAACGTCHEVNVGAVVSGSHDEHLTAAGVNGCGDCHTGAANNASSYNSSNHVNGLIDVSNTYSAGGAPGNDYGTCSTASCHDDGTGTRAVTPAWGTSPAACTACHDEVPGTGSHQKHIVTTAYNKADCGDCHDGAVQGLTAPDQHLDNNIDVYDSSSGDLGYPENKTKGTVYSNCTTAYCHSTGQSTSDGNSSLPTYAAPAWGSPASAACGTCHRVSEITGLTSGSHAAHLGSAGVNGCGDCHTGAADDASSYDSVTHVDGFIDVANTYSAEGAPGNGYGICSTAFCHEDGTGTMVDSPTWGSTPAACSACHEAVPTTGSHSNHLTNATGHGYKRPACGNCHDGSVESTTPPEQHLDGNIDVYDSVSGDLGYTENKVKGTAYASCSTAYCHSSGQSYTDPNDPTPTYASPTWGVGQICGSCHKAETGHNMFSQTIDSGSHTKHLSYNFNTGSTSIRCTVCHKWDSSQPFGDCNQCHRTAGANTYHANGEINVFLDTEFGPRTAYGDQTGTPGNGYFTCSNTYCHTDGTSVSTGSVPNNTSPAWGTAGPLACDSCHGGPPAGPAYVSGSPKANSHAAHTGTYNCDECHSSTVDGLNNIANTNNHVNKAYNVSGANIGSYSYDAAGGTCSATTCHGSTSPQWGTDLSGVNECTRCHGNQGTGDAYPPNDTNGDNAATDDQVGAHIAHMTLPSGYTSQLNSTGNCNECHKVPSATGDADHIDSALPAEVYPGTIDPEKADLNSVSPNYASGTCTVYCHGSSMPKGSNNGSDTAPEWNQNGYLSGAPGDNNDGSGDCEKCHGSPPNIAPHTGSETLSDCDTCHLHFNDGGTLNNASLHINGIVEASGGCNSCHAYPPAIGDGKPYQDAPVSEGKGAHVTHVNNIAAEKGVTLDPASDTFGAGAAAAVCGVCHTNNISNHMSGTRVINFGDGSTEHQFGTSAPVYNGVVGTSSGTTPKTCSNVSCHFDDSPAWQDPATAGN